MSSVNKVFLVGRLGRDPEIKQLAGGQTVARISLATSRSYTDRAGARQEKTQWHRVVAWDRQAEVARDYAHKGDLVCVEGALEYRQIEVEGRPVTLSEVRLLRLELLTPKPGQRAPAPGHAPAPARAAAAPADGGGWDPGPAPSDMEVPF